MRYSVLHLSDLHRDPNDELDNLPLIESLVRDADTFATANPSIPYPAIAVVSGDLIYGVKPGVVDYKTEIRRQYDEARAFLDLLTERFFDSDRSKVVILPGNHDVCYGDVLASAQLIPIPAEMSERRKLVEEFFSPKSSLRWSWSELTFYRIVDQEKYQSRLEDFSNLYSQFYNGQRQFDLNPENQYQLFDYPALELTVAALSSCHNNDPFHRAGAFHPRCIAHVSRLLGSREYSGRLILGAWHHSVFGSPAQDDFADSGILQVLIDKGFSLGLHGHQHRTQFVDERYQLDTRGRKITVVSAGTLCAGPRHLNPGEPRSYNVIEIDTTSWVGRIHQRVMMNRDFAMPIWGPGRFAESQRPHVEFPVCPPPTTRHATVDAEIQLERAAQLVSKRQWPDALAALSPLAHVPLARPLLVKVVHQLMDPKVAMDVLWPPTSIEEAVVIGTAILNNGTFDQCRVFVDHPTITNLNDATVRTIVDRITERRLR